MRDQLGPIRTHQTVPPSSLPGGTIIQSISKVIPAATGSTTFPADDTTPLDSEGTEIVSQAITAADDTNKVHLTASLMIMGDISVNVSVVAFRGSVAIGAATVQKASADDSAVVSLNIEDSPASASAQTYSIRIGSSSGTWYCNREPAAQFNGQQALNSMTLQEIVAS